MAVLIDSGFLFASLNASESEHQATIRVLENMREPQARFYRHDDLALAERLNITRVLTLDRRDFQMIRPKHCSGFEILP
jgi:uncharacterized protein